MIRVRRILTDAACLLGGLVTAPIRRRRAAELAAGAVVRSIVVLNEVGGLGNLVMLSGLLLNLRRLYPGATIAVAMPSSPLARAVIGADLVDEFLFFEATAGDRARLLQFARRVLRPRQFDLGLATFFSASLLTSCVLAVARCRYRVAYAQARHRGFLNTITLLDAGGHELERHLRLLEFTAQPLTRQTAVRAEPETRRHGGDFLARRGLGIHRPLLGVHPGCDRVNALKRWPAERFVAVINRVVKEALADAVVFLGPDDMELQAVLAQSLDPQVPIICAETLERVVALIGQCQAFLSNDSGLMHVAAALDVPVVAIFGPTDTVKNEPVGRATMLTASGVPCRPCYTGAPVTCRYDRRYCLEGIGVDEVIGAVGRVLTLAATSRASAPGTAARLAGHAG